MSCSSKNVVSKEQSFFFKSSDHDIFGIMYYPAQRDANTGFVFCSPFGSTGNLLRHVYASFARRLSSAGYYVLRFDYMGTGNSSGDFENATVETRVSDTIEAISTLQNISGVQNIGILGTRLGVAWASMAAIRSPFNVVLVVFWEPILDFNSFFYNALRQSVTFQTTVFRKVIFNRDQIINELISDGVVEYDGYHLNVLDGYIINRDFYMQLAGLDIKSLIKNCPGNMLIVQIDENDAPFRPEFVDCVNFRRHDGKTLDLLQVSELMPWMPVSDQFRNPEPAKLFNVTENWIKESLMG